MLSATADSSLRALRVFNDNYLKEVLEECNDLFMGRRARGRARHASFSASAGQFFVCAVV